MSTSTPATKPPVSSVPAGGTPVQVGGTSGQTVSPPAGPPKPDFILDMDPNESLKLPAEKGTRGRWCIRRWVDVETEWFATHAQNDPVKYGIISYAWGPWHDKSKRAYGSIAGNIEEEARKQFATGSLTGGTAYGSHAQYMYPTFNLGPSKALSSHGADLKGQLAFGTPAPTVGGTAPVAPANPSPVQQEVLTVTATPATREIPVGTPLSWIFPVLRARERVGKKDKDGKDIDEPSTAPWTIDQMYNALLALKTRFIWWDWACIPQGWPYDPWTGAPRGAEFQVHKELSEEKARSMNNMRYFYPNSTVGCLWWHQSIWDPSIQPAYLTPKAKFESGTTRDKAWLEPIAPGDLKPQDGPGNRDYNSIQWVVNSILNMSSWDITTDNPEGLTPETLVAGATHGAVFQFIQNLIAARAHETSLRSLWSFQEGVLFTSSRRPLRSAEQARADNVEQNPSVILDRYGKDLWIKDVKDQGLVKKRFSKVFTYGNVNLVDICFIATLVAAALADGIISRAYTPNESRYWLSKAPGLVPNYFISFVEWCGDKANDGAARLLLSKLLNTGLVGYEYDSPLTLLEGKFGRSWELWQSDMDVLINTIMGTLEIDFEKQLKVASVISDTIAKSETSTDKALKAAAAAKGAQAEIDSAKPEFIKSLVDLYQWRLLLLARGDEFKGPGEMGYTVPFWETLISKERAAFAPLNIYLVGRDKELANEFGPNRGRSSKPTVTVTGLPKLSVPNLKSTYLRVEASPTYTIFEFPTTATTAGWTEAFCYQYVKPGEILGEIAPGATVETIALAFEDRTKLVPSTGNICLLPIREGYSVEGITKRSVIQAGNYTVTSPARIRAARAAASEAQYRASVDDLIAKFASTSFSNQQNAVVQAVNQPPPAPGSLPDWTTCAILIKYQKAPPPSNPPNPNPPVTTAVFWGVGDFKGLKTPGDTKLTSDIYMY